MQGDDSLHTPKAFHTSQQGAQRAYTGNSSADFDDLLSPSTGDLNFDQPSGNQIFTTQGTGVILEELPDDDDNSIDWVSDSSDPVTKYSKMSTLIDPLFTNLPPIRDILQTETSILQDGTLEEVLPFLSANTTLFPKYSQYGLPPLLRDRHIAFLHKALCQLPAPYTAADAGRPWYFYWALCGLSNLGVDVSTYRERLVSTVQACQHPDGGFGGGHGQMAHLAPSYAILLSLAMVGGDAAYDCIDRVGMWKWLGRCKSTDGGFCMSVGGEEDVRGAYCAVTLISLLDLPTRLPEDETGRFPDGTDLLSGLAEWVSRCQTFEGGISSRPDAEAHGAYAFCALACLCVMGAPHEIVPQFLDVPLLVSWLSARQYGPEGGFAGRTNKLVDGCYSHWIGGCWPLIEAVLHPSESEGARLSIGKSIYSREGLIRYILCCCQETSKRGGLRDKPSIFSDAYHSCYVLAGLSAAQHRWDYGIKGKPWTDEGNQLKAAYQWQPADNPTYNDSFAGVQVFGEEDRVERLHPVFVVPVGTAEAMRKHCVWKAFTTQV